MRQSKEKRPQFELRPLSLEQSNIYALPAHPSTVVILWVTNPVSAHLIARMELVTGRGIEPDTLPGGGEQEL